MLRNSLAQIKQNPKPIDGLVVYGGTFDPIHQGHLGVIADLTRAFRYLVIAPAQANPWKETQPTPLVDRVAMITIALNCSFPGIDLGILTGDEDIHHVSIFADGYKYSKEVIDFLRFTTPTISTIWWAVGEDIEAEVPCWKDWDSLAIPLVVAPINIPVHATEIRSGKQEPLACLAEYIQDHKLYE